MKKGRKLEDQAQETFVAFKALGYGRGPGN